MEGDLAPIRRLLLALALALAATALGPSLARAATGTPALPPNVDFGPATVGYQASGEVPLVNEGEAALMVEAVKIEGEDPGDFVLEGSNCQGFLAAGQSCRIGVRFSPTATGPRSAVLKVLSDGTPATATVALEGEGAAAGLGFEPGGVDFGLVEVGRGGEDPVQVRNTGAAPIRLDSLETTGPDAGEFWVSSFDCQGATLAAGATCSLEVHFNAGREGEFQAAVAIRAAGTSFEAPIEGRAARPHLEASSNPLSFAPTTIGTTTAGRLEITNVGALPVGWFIATLSGGDVGDFHLLEESCTGRPLEPGRSCAATVGFAPQAAGARRATISFFGDGESAAQVALEGEGIAPSLAFGPASHDFGGVAIGAAPQSETFRLTNQSAGAYTVGSVALAGVDAGEFRLREDRCSEATLEPGAACTVVASFDPETTGAKAATLRLRGVTGASASLTGEGLPAAPIAKSAADPSLSSPAPSAGRVELTRLRRPHRTFGGRWVVGRLRCASRGGCLVRVDGRSRPAGGHGRALPVRPVRVGLRAGEGLPLAVAPAPRARRQSSALALSLRLRWQSGEAGGTRRLRLVVR